MIIQEKFGVCWDPVDRKLAWVVLSEFVVSFVSPHLFLSSGCQRLAEGWRQLLAGE